MSTTSLERIQLPIEGMTCASCATRIEKRLNKLDGVEATVNYATENAAVSFDPARVAPEELVAAVGAAGYRATLALPGVGAKEQTEVDPVAPLRRRLIVSAALSLPVLLLAMIEPLQFDYWQWLSLLLATPVVLWGGWPFHRAAWLNLKHATATMDTLISVGTLSAWGWSLVALFFLGAGETGMTTGFELVLSRDEDRRASLSRGGRGRDHLRPRRPLLRGSREATRGSRIARSARAGRQGGERPRRRRPRAAHRDRRAPGR